MMTNSNALFESLVNLPHTVLGIKLKPLCLLHILWLYHIQSPLVVTSEQSTIKDLELACLICASSSSEEILARLDPSPLSRIKRFFWHKANAKRNLAHELKAFIAYNDDFVALPQFYSTEDRETNDAIPWFLIAAANVIKETGWQEDIVFTMPLGKLLWLNLTLGYLNTGKTQIISEKEQLAMKALSELQSP